MDGIFAHPNDSTFAALSKSAARLSLSVVRSWRYMPNAAAVKLLSMLSADNLWTLCLILAAWAIATIVGGPLAIAVDGFLLIYGLYSLYEQLSATWGSLRGWASAAYYATDEKQLDQAAKYFAESVAEGSLDLLAVLLTHKAFVKARVVLRDKFPPPEWLKEELTNAESQRAKGVQKSSEGTEQQSDRSKSTGQETGSEVEPRYVRRFDERLRSSSDGVDVRDAMDFGRAGAAGNPAPSSSIPALIAGAVVLVGLGGVVAIASVGGSSDKARRK